MADEGAQMSFRDRMSYGDYLQLDRILTAQKPLTDAPDELLFIIQHQASELWMKLALHELQGARQAILDARVPEAMKQLARVSRVLEHLNDAWDILRTMTPSDYTTFRDALGQSSGFQSHQYRMIEFLLGNRNRKMIKPHAHRPADRQALEDELIQPTLYQAVLRYAATLGHDLPEAALSPIEVSHRADPAIMAFWARIYQDTAAHWTMYALAEKLIDIEDYFRRWRFNHVTTVERVIGLKRGTGGTSGVTYLKHMLEVELFPDLWHVRTEL